MKTTCLLALCLLPAAAGADSPAPSARPVRFMLHGGYSAEPPGEDYLRFVEQIRPDVVILGVFDQRLSALAAPSDPKRKPQDPAELLARWKPVADQLHRSGIRKALYRAAGGEEKLSRFGAPWTVEAQAYRQKGRVVVHLVNYNHREKAAGKSVAEREAPIAAAPVTVRVVVPEGVKVRPVRFFSPDDERVHALAFAQHEGVVTFTTPSFLVYGLCAVSG